MKNFRSEKPNGDQTQQSVERNKLRKTEHEEIPLELVEPEDTSDAELKTRVEIEIYPEEFITFLQQKSELSAFYFRLLLPRLYKGEKLNPIAAKFYEEYKATHRKDKNLSSVSK